MRSTIALLSAVALLSPLAAQAQSTPSTCRVEAGGWIDDEAELVLSDVVVRCRGFLIEAPRAVRRDGRLHLQATDAAEVCLAPSDQALTCCAPTGEELDESWVLSEARCAGLGAGEVRADEVRLEAGALYLDGARVGAPFSLPARSGHFDAAGRRAGFRAPVLGYDELGGAGGRLGYYLPFARRASVDLGVFGESEAPAVGAFTTWRWGDDARSSALSLAGGWDGAAPYSARAALEGDATLVTADASAGLTLRGYLGSDGALAQDWALADVERLRSERLQDAAAWLGSDQERLWLASHRRSAAIARADGTSGLLYRGTLLEAGYAAGHDVADVASLDARLSAARTGRWGAPGLASVTRMRALAGADLRALRLPYLSLRPGLWLDLGADFTDPERGDVARRFDGRLLATATLSSAWVARGPAGSHTLELAWDARLVPVRERQLDGDDDADAALPPLFGEPRYQTQVRIDQTFARASEGRMLRWYLPLAWRFDGDRSLVLARSELSLHGQNAHVGWDLDAAFDTVGGPLAGLGSRLELGFGPPAASRPAAARVRLAGGARWLRAGTAPAALRPLSTVPWLGAGEPDPIAEELLRADLVAGVDVAWFGLEGEASWPLGVDATPSVGGTLYVGNSGDYRLAIGAWRLADETVLALTSFGVDFGGRAAGPWSPSPLAPLSLSR